MGYVPPTRGVANGQHVQQPPPPEAPSFISPINHTPPLPPPVDPSTDPHALLALAPPSSGHYIVQPPNLYRLDAAVQLGEEQRRIRSMWRWRLLLLGAQSRAGHAFFYCAHLVL